MFFDASEEESGSILDECESISGTKINAEESMGLATGQLKR